MNSGNGIVSAGKMFTWCQVFSIGLGFGILWHEKKLLDFSVTSEKFGTA